jgi:hypothetical protein
VLLNIRIEFVFNHCRLISDDSREVFYEWLCRVVSLSNVEFQLPSNWDMGHGIPAVTPLLDDPPQDFLKWARSQVNVQMQHRLDAKPLSRTEMIVDVTEADLVDIWKQNGGSICRVTGVAGSWTPKSSLLLTMDRIDSSVGYTKKNLVITLHRFNIARCDYRWDHFLHWRDALISRFSNATPEELLERYATALLPPAQDSCLPAQFFNKLNQSRNCDSIFLPPPWASPPRALPGNLPLVSTQTLPLRMQTQVLYKLITTVSFALEWLRAWLQFLPRRQVPSA